MSKRKLRNDPPSQGLCDTLNSPKILFWKRKKTEDLLSFSLSTIDDFERQVRRLEDKLRAAEGEKIATENAKKYLEDEIRRLNQ